MTAPNLTDAECRKIQSDAAAVAQGHQSDEKAWAPWGMYERAMIDLAYSAGYAYGIEKAAKVCDRRAYRESVCCSAAIRALKDKQET